MHIRAGLGNIPHGWGLEGPPVLVVLGDKITARIFLQGAEPLEMIQFVHKSSGGRPQEVCLKCLILGNNEGMKVVNETPSGKPRGISTKDIPILTLQAAGYLP